MPYTPTDWVDNTTPLSASNLNNLETQYSDAMTDGGIPYGVDTSATANTITATVSPAPTAYTDGYSVRVKVANTTTGATTLNVNGLGAVAVNNADGTAVGAGDLVAGVPRIFMYVAAGTPFFVASGSGGLSASGTATPAEVLAPNTFTSAGGRAQAGTMPNLSGNWQTAAFKGTSNNGSENGVLAQIPLGYSDGGVNTYTICYDPNFAAQSIANGVPVFGLTGTYTGYATGTATYNSGLTVSGLAFQPSRVIVLEIDTTGTASHFAFDSAQGDYVNDGSNGGYGFSAVTYAASSGGFSLSNGPGGAFAVYWIALE